MPPERSQNANEDDTKIFILYSETATEEDEVALEVNGVIINGSDVLGVLLWTDGSVKRAWAGTGRKTVNELTAGNYNDLRKCTVQVICPPPESAPWKIMMEAATLLAGIQDRLQLVEVPAWSFQTFGLDKVTYVDR